MTYDGVIHSTGGQTEDSYLLTCFGKDTSLLACFVRDTSLLICFERDSSLLSYFDEDSSSLTSFDEERSSLTCFGEDSSLLTCFGEDSSSLTCFGEDSSSLTCFDEERSPFTCFRASSKILLSSNVVLRSKYLCVFSVDVPYEILSAWGFSGLVRPLERSSPDSKLIQVSSESVRGLHDDSST